MFSSGVFLKAVKSRNCVVKNHFQKHVIWTTLNLCRLVKDSIHYLLETTVFYLTADQFRNNVKCNEPQIFSYSLRAYSSFPKMTSKAFLREGCLFGTRDSSEVFLYKCVDKIVMMQNSDHV